MDGMDILDWLDGLDWLDILDKLDGDFCLKKEKFL